MSTGSPEQITEEITSEQAEEQITYEELLQTVKCPTQLSEQHYRIAYQHLFEVPPITEHADEEIQRVYRDFKGAVFACVLHLRSLPMDEHVLAGLASSQMDRERSYSKEIAQKLHEEHGQSAATE